MSRLVGINHVAVEVGSVDGAIDFLEFGLWAAHAARPARVDGLRGHA